MPVAAYVASNKLAIFFITPYAQTCSPETQPTLTQVTSLEVICLVPSGATKGFITLFSDMQY